MKITFIQTASGKYYKKIMDATSRTIVEYCDRHGHSYEMFVGIRRGSHHWQATFNRIPMLGDLIDRGHDGWVVYMDADAYIHDLDFDLSTYLADKADRSGIMVSIEGQPKPWAINAGVFMLNLGHPFGREIVRKWQNRFAAIDDAELAEMVDWPEHFNDQSMLYDVLGLNAHLRDSVLYESGTVMNHPYARFIRQVLRAFYPDIQARTAAIVTAVEEVLPSSEADVVEQVYPLMLSALYRSLLHRDPEAGALDRFYPRFREKGLETGFRETLDELVQSPEYRDRGKPTSEANVIAGYRWVLGREADADGLRQYAAAISAGDLTVQDMRLELLKSREFADHYGSLVAEA